MGKLNIAHHKSYHPYRLDNIERVRRDEEEARRKEEGQEDRMRLADSEARLGLLRSRTDSKNVSSNVNAESQPQEGISTSSGHINLFADLEHHEIAATIERSRQFKKTTKAEEEKGIRLGPSAEDLKPWYTDAKRDNEDLPENKKMKDLSSKLMSDPLTSITHQLSRSHPPSRRDSSSSMKYNSPVNGSSEARIQRESKEKARAMELIRKRQKEKEREMSGSVCMTPSTVDFDHASGYGDVYNPRETREAHRRWDRNGFAIRKSGEDKGRAKRWSRLYQAYAYFSWPQENLVLDSQILKIGQKDQGIKMKVSLTIKGGQARLSS